MTAPTNIYVHNLMQFIGKLRLAGLKPGLDETNDALRIISELGLESRTAIKTALGVLLAKSEEELRVYSETFDAFFLSYEEQEKRFAQIQNEIEAHQARLQKSADELTFQGERLDLPETLIEIYANMPESEQERIREFLEQTSHGTNVGPRFKPVAENVIRGRLNTAAQKSANGGHDTSSHSLLYKSISAISQDEVPQALQLIRRLVLRMNAQLTHILKRSNRRGMLDMKATIHKSLNTGGTPVKLKFRAKRRRKQRMLILCDVSASMMLFSGFGLQFILGMRHTVDKSDIFIFSEGFEKIKASDMTDVGSFESYVTSSHVWGKGTNLSPVLDHILNDRTIQLSSAIVLIFSDSKTMNPKKVTDLLASLFRRSKKILWMNPLPENDWNYLPWINQFQKYASMLDCSTLERLSEACSHAGYFSL